MLGLLFGLAIYMNLKKLPVHRAMREISELIYETCKTYLITQGKFILILEIFIGIIIILYFGVLSRMEPFRVAIILAFSLVGIAGSYGVAWFGIRVNTFANSRTAFASLGGKPFPLYAIPLKAGMSIGMMLISVELLIMLCILLFIPGDYAGPCFIGFAIGESLGAAALRIAGGIFTKIADIGADLMKIVFKIKEDDARNPGVIADCTGDNAGDSGATARLDLRDAHHDDHRERGLLLYQRRDCQSALCQSRPDELRVSAHIARLDYFNSLRDRHVRHLVVNDPGAGRRSHAVVETFCHHLLRHARGRHHSRTG
jgi:Na+/H+-translocating membrane pyrophosphatase